MALEISNNRDKQKSDRDLSIFAACKKFEELHPMEEQPKWLKYCLKMRAVRNENKNWVVQMRLLPKPELKPNQYWELEDDGIPMLYEVDPETKKKSVVICCGPPMDMEVFFETEVDLLQNRVTVIVDMDLNKLDCSAYEINCW